MDEKDAPGKFGQMIPDPNVHLPRLQTSATFATSATSANIEILGTWEKHGKASDGCQDYTLDAPVVPMVRQFVVNFVAFFLVC